MRSKRSLNASTDAPLVGGTPVNGWCYVDANALPPVGNPEIVAGCPVTDPRLLRFVGAGHGEPGAGLFISCSGS